MRVIFLNLFQGKIEDGLLDFVSKNATNTDIFCFQEANESIYEKIIDTLRDFKPFFISKAVPDIGVYRISTFINKRHVTKKRKRILNGRFDLGLAEMLTITSNFCSFSVSNIHGTPRPGDKLDSKSRLEQTKEILRANLSLRHPTIIGGDFNLLPDTESIKKFEENGFRNLIKEFGIKTTRNHSVWKREKISPYGYFGQQIYADYVFVSPEVKVKDFQVPNVEISDHLPLILDFEI